MSSVTVSNGQVEFAFQQWLDQREAFFERRKAKIIENHLRDLEEWKTLGWFSRKFLHVDPNDYKVEDRIANSRRWFDADYRDEIREIRNLLASNKNEITITDRHSFIFRDF